MKNKFDLSTAQWFGVDKKNKFLKEMDLLINEYSLCVDAFLYVEPLKVITCFCYDDSLAQLFSDSGITLGMSHNVRKEFKVDQDGEVVGLKCSDYIEQLELKQNGQTYLVPVYCCWNGCSLDYGIALYEAVLVKEESEVTKTKTDLKGVRLIDVNMQVGEGFLQDWYVHSVLDTDEPKWTDKHVSELCNDFIIIPKESAKTIYDIDKVVEEMKANSKKMSETTLPHTYYKAIGTRKCEEIIRNGGK